MKLLESAVTGTGPIPMDHDSCHPCTITLEDCVTAGGHGCWNSTKLVDSLQQADHIVNAGKDGHRASDTE